MYGTFDEDQYLMNKGRKATSTGLIGMLLMLLYSFINNISPFFTVTLTFIVGYIFLTGFWGGYNINKWFLKYRSQMPDFVWQIARIPVISLGIILGPLLWGLLEHLFLMLAMEDTIDESHFSSFIAVFILLLPIIGPWYSRKINYTTRKRH